MGVVALRCVAGRGRLRLRFVAYASESEASLPIFTKGATVPFFHQHDGFSYN